MQNMATMQYFPVWYLHFSVEELMEMVNRKEQERLQKGEEGKSPYKPEGLSQDSRGR